MTCFWFIHLLLQKHGSFGQLVAEGCVAGESVLYVLHYWSVLAPSELVKWETRSSVAEHEAVSAGGWRGALEVSGASPAHSRDNAKARQAVQDLSSCILNISKDRDPTSPLGPSTGVRPPSGGGISFWYLEGVSLTAACASCLSTKKILALSPPWGIHRQQRALSLPPFLVAQPPQPHLSYPSSSSHHSMVLWGSHQCTGLSGAGAQAGPVPRGGLTSARQRGASSSSCPYLSSLAIRVDQAQLVLSESLLAVPIISLYFMCTALRRVCSICLSWDRHCLLRRCTGQYAALIL